MVSEREGHLQYEMIAWRAVSKSGPRQRVSVVDRMSSFCPYVAVRTGAKESQSTDPCWDASQSEQAFNC